MSLGVYGLKLELVITYLFRWNRVVNLTLQHLYSLEERMHLDMWLCGLHGRFGCCGVVKSAVPLPRIEPRSLSSWPVILLPQMYRPIKSSYIINVFFPLQCHHMSLVDFVDYPPGCGRSVTDFWGWDAHEAQLRFPDEVDGDIWIWGTRRGLKPKFY
jgi:hypothetical protein